MTLVNSRQNSQSIFGFVTKAISPEYMVKSVAMRQVPSIISLLASQHSFKCYIKSFIISEWTAIPLEAAVPNTHTHTHTHIYIYIYTYIYIYSPSSQHNSH
jgi:hypothetical protein